MQIEYSSPIDCKRFASRTLISVFESTSASENPWTTDGMNWFLEKVEFSSPCLVPSLYCSVSVLKCFSRHNIFLGTPPHLLTLGIAMVTLSPISIGRKIWLLLDIILLLVLINCCALSEFGLILCKVHMCICLVHLSEIENCTYCIRVHNP